MKKLMQWGCVCVTLVVLSACAPSTRVILLPQGSNTTSAVDVKGTGGTVRLAAPYQTANVSQKGQLELTTTDPLVVMERYGSLLTKIPDAAEQFVLNFETGSSDLTAESQTLLPSILTRARTRQGGEIIVIGHTDRVGTVSANDALSLQRAKAIRQLFLDQGFRPDLIDAVGRGERSPLVPTADEVAEPKNRRAEVVVQ